jgi:pyruvate dehydrogenase (quinone)
METRSNGAGAGGGDGKETAARPETVADFLVRRLRAWGVARIFGYAGDGINPIMGALDRAGNRPELIQPTHEELAALMACAHAKLTGEVGVCLATQGPGAIHTLNGLYDAALDHQPVVAIVGQQARESRGGRAQQEVDLQVLFKDVAKAFVQEVVSPDQAKHVIDRAFRIALAERAVTCVILPHDVQQEPAVEEPAHEHGAQHSGVGYVAPRVVPAESELRRAAAVLNAGKRVAVLVGAGALHATDEVIAVAERLGAGVAKALLGKAAVPDDLPFVTGSVGWLGTAASNAMLERCDTLLMVGSGFPYTEFLPAPGTARGVQIDIAGRMLSLRYPMEVGLVGDSAETLSALLPLLEPKPDSWRPWIEEQVSAWWRLAAERARRPAEPLNPQLVFHELSPRLPEGCIVTGDSGSSTVWYARHLKLRRGMRATLSGTLATMGSAIPYALAAKYAYPDRPAVATAGDGALQMSGINALIDVARAWRRWSDPRLIVLVLNNRELNYVTWEQRVMEGERKFPASQDIPDFPYARYAELLGLRGVRVDAPEGVAAAWDEAFAADRPVVVEAVVDPNVPTVPPQLKPEQVEKLQRALAGGDPAAAGVLRQARAEGAL